MNSRKENQPALSWSEALAEAGSVGRTPPSANVQRTPRPLNATHLPLGTPTHFPGEAPGGLTQTMASAPRSIRARR